MNYPIHEELRVAIKALFDDVSIADGFLGKDVPRAQRALSGSQGDDPIARIGRLRDQLESYIIRMAAELEELGEDEGPRLRSEATGYLVVLGNIHGLFPEFDRDVATN